MEFGWLRGDTAVDQFYVTYLMPTRFYIAFFWGHKKAPFHLGGQKRFIVQNVLSLDTLEATAMQSSMEGVSLPFIG